VFAYRRPLAPRCRLTFVMRSDDNAHCCRDPSAGTLIP
jgi:hypothetical protein